MKSYRPEELFDESGRLRPELAELAPAGDRRMSANPHANGGLLLRDLRLPDFRDYAVEVPAPGAVDGRIHARHGRLPARRDEAEHGGAGTSGCSAPTRTTRTAGRTCSRSPTAPGSPRPSRGTTTSRPTAG